MLNVIYGLKKNVVTLIVFSDAMTDLKNHQWIKEMGLKLEYYTPNDEEFDNWLRDNDICNDDYDFALFCECTTFASGKKAIAAMEFHLLHGCFKNACKIVANFFGRDGILGISYHG